MQSSVETELVMEMKMEMIETQRGRDKDDRDKDNRGRDRDKQWIKSSEYPVPQAIHQGWDRPQHKAQR